MVGTVLVCALIVVFGLIFLPPATAQDETVPPGSTDEKLLFREIPSVYGASKYDQKVTEAPSAVSIVTADEIKKNGYRTLADIFKSVRGFYVTNDRNYAYLGVRGFNRPGDYNSRILLLVDGHRINENVYDSFLIETGGIIDVDLIERVEIVRGPGSSLYGSNAFFAVVNVITRRGRAIKGFEASGEAASFGTRRGRVTGGTRFSGGSELILSGSAYRSDGQDLYFSEFDPAGAAPDDRAANNGIAEGRDYDRNENAFVKWASGDFAITGAYHVRTKGIPTGSYEMDFNDTRNKSYDNRSYLEAKYDRSLGGKWNLSALVYYDYYKYKGDYAFGGILNKDIGYGEWVGSEVRLAGTAFDGHQVVVGGEYRNNIRQDMYNFDQEPYVLSLDVRRTSELKAFYIQDEITIGRKFRVNAGLRHDHYETFGGTTNPRLALIYAPAPANAWKILYGRAFRAPNVYELYWFLPGSWKANPTLRPETVNTYELIHERYLGERLRVSLGGFYSVIKDLINSESDGVEYQFRNTEKVAARGIELELEQRWKGGVDSRFSYTVQRNENRQTGEKLSNSPQHLAKLNLVVPIIKGRLSAALEEQYMSRRTLIAGGYAASFWITNITIFSQRALGGVELSASVYNVFDKDYSDPASGDFAQEVIPQDGRSFRLKATYSF